MASREDVELQRRSLLSLSTRARRDLERIWKGLDPTNAIATRDALLEFLPDVVQTYGEAAASTSADFYENVRESAGATGSLTTPLASAAPTEQIHASTRWALGGLFTDGDPDLEAVLGNLAKVTDRLVKQPGRQTIMDAVQSDPATPRFARIPTGPVTCAFCAMLASRGAVYLTEETADGRDYHDFCDCVAAPIFAGQPLPQGYDPEHYMNLYKDGLDLSNRDAVIKAAPSAPAPTNPNKGQRTRTRKPVTPEPEPEPVAPAPAPEPIAAPEPEPSPAPLTDTDEIPGFENFKRHSAGSMLDEADEVNPFYVTSRSYQVNCQMCTTTTEMRMRGYDVEAMPNTKRNANVPYLPTTEIPKRWRHADGTPGNWEATPFSKAALDSHVEGWPEGARGMVAVHWNNRTGHIFNVQKVNGKAVYIDAQPARNNESALRQPFEQRVAWGTPFDPGCFVMRVDHMTPDASLAGQLRSAGTHLKVKRAEQLATRENRRRYIPRIKALEAERRRVFDARPTNGIEMRERNEKIRTMSREILELRMKAGIRMDEIL